MTKYRPTPEERLLTDTELELMRILWSLGEGTVKDVIAALPPGRNLAYTSVSTIIRILEKKNILESRKGAGNSFVYKPIITKQAYEQKSLNHLLKNVFSDTPSSLIKTLVNSKGMTASDLDEIKKIISESTMP